LFYFERVFVVPCFYLNGAPCFYLNGAKVPLRYHGTVICSFL